MKLAAKSGVFVWVTSTWYTMATTCLVFAFALYIWAQAQQSALLFLFSASAFLGGIGVFYEALKKKRTGGDV